MRTPRLLRLFMAQSGLWMTLCVAAELVSRYLLHWGYPYNYPMLPPGAIFGDFRSYIPKFPHFHSRAFFGGPILTYPAPTAALFKLFLPRPYTHLLLPTLRYISVILIASCVALRAFYRAMVRRGLQPRSAALFCVGLYATSYPFWFEIHQGNIEFAVWIVLMLGFWTFCRAQSYAAAICFGIAGALKLFPFIFVGLFLARKQYRQMLVVFLVAIVCTIAGLWLLCPDMTYSWQQTERAMGSLRPDPILNLPPVVSGFDHSLWVLLKRCVPILPGPVQLGRWLDVYLGAVGIAGCVLFFTRIRKLPVVNQILTLTIACILLPPVSYDYTLIHLYLPFALVVFVTLAGKDRSAPMIATLSLFAFLLSWQSEFILHGVRFAGQPRLSLCLLYSVLRSYIRSSLRKTLSPSDPIPHPCSPWLFATATT